MSCVAMCITNHSYHTYMKRFAPQCVALSFVDNLEVLAASGQDLLQGAMSVQAWADMWQLSIDKKKTFVWGATGAARQQCEPLGWVKRHAIDLGAPRTYGAGLRVKEQKARLEGLDSLWPLLRRSPAHYYQKAQVLRQAFWPRAFYGSAICRLGWQHIKTLRTSALRTLGHAKAGAHLGVRLFLLLPDLTDPGFFQVWHILTTYRRICLKQPRFKLLLADFMDAFDGTLANGPFNKLLETCGYLAWTLHADGTVTTQDGATFCLATISESVLRFLTQDAWAQHLARDLESRKDFDGLEGIDLPILRRALRHQEPQAQPCLDVLRDGTFVDPLLQRRFDMRHSVVCSLCGSTDSLDHRAMECRALHPVHEKHPDATSTWPLLPQALAHHLIPSRATAWGSFRSQLMMEHEPVNWANSPSASSDQMVHLFTDGSALMPEIPELTLGAWAVVDASADLTLASGYLNGLEQNNDRAELMAIVVATEWCVQHQVTATIWSDSAFALGGAVLALTQGLCEAHELYPDLWLRLVQAQQHASGVIHYQHVPAHRAQTDSTSPLEDWLTLWNNRADRAAFRAHQDRPHGLREAWKRLVEDHHQRYEGLLALQALHFDLSNALQTSAPTIDAVEGAEDEFPPPPFPERQATLEDASWNMTLADAWSTSPSFLQLGLKFSPTFSEKVMAATVQMHDHPDAVVYRLSWLEMTFWIHSEVTTSWPMRSPTLPSVWVDSNSMPAALQGHITLAAALQWTKSFFREANDTLGLHLVLISNLDLGHLAVHPPLTGLFFRLPPSVFAAVTRTLQDFTSHRPIRKAVDLSRALR